MPISRKKACEQCRLAKAKCSLESVCSRCLTRGLTCKYTGGPPRVGPYTRPHLLQPECRLSSASPAVTLEPLSSLFCSPDLGFSCPDFGAGDLLREDTALNNIQLANWNPSQINEPRGTSLAQATLNSSEAEAHSNPSLNGLFNSMSPWGFTGNSQFSDTRLNQLAASRTEKSAESMVSARSPTQPDCPSSPVDDESVVTAEMKDGTTLVFKGKPYGRSQALRRGVSTQQSLMATMLSGQIENYPKMLIQGSRLPPFIYPQCVLNNMLYHQCVADNGSHQCLSEPLANCATLTRMYYSRSPNNTQFVWKTIYNEQKRLYKEFSTFDVPTLLAAVQAIVIYILIQAQDPESMAKNDVASMAITLAEMAKALHYRSQYQIGILRNPNLGLKTWVIHESIRRTVNLFYVIGIVTIIRIGGAQQTGCCGILETPLPCGRELWEPEATETFGIRLHRYKSRLVSDRGLIINDLYHALDPGQLGKNEVADPLIQKDLATWCESQDDLGTLVWMTSLLDRQSR
ncbi:hypothetical protein EV127DRAFT_239310 [Xylaria flabelliformis]|nr:hypothetical protein EV127DRAFT_239310 [Xylaria flabelliformis]